MSLTVQPKEISTTVNKTLKETFETPDKAIDYAIQSKSTDVNLASFENLITDEHVRKLAKNLSLKSLTIASNKVTRLHRELKTIEILIISKCSQIKIFPEGFKALKTLECVGTTFAALPESMHKLEVLHAEDSKLTTLPKLKNLRELFISGSTCASLPEGMDKLEVLHAEDSKLTTLPKLKNLKELFISDNLDTDEILDRFEAHGCMVVFC